jgi:hypothetical protein
MGGGGSIAPPFLASALDGGVVSFTSRPVYRCGTSPRYPLDRRLGVPQSQSKRCAEKKNLAMPGIEPGPSSTGKYDLQI